MIEIPLTQKVRLIKSWPYEQPPPWPWRAVEEPRPVEDKKTDIYASRLNSALIYTAIGFFLYLAATR